MATEPPPAVTFSYTIGSPNTLIVSVTASVTCLNTCPSFDYDWDWGDGTAHDSGQSASHTYASPGAKVITLTVALSGQFVGSVKRSLTLPNPDFPPTAAATCTWNANTWTMTVLDASSDDGPDADTLPGDGNASLQVVVEWGDGSTKSFGKQGASLGHTYISTGTFLVGERAIDSKLQQDSVTCPVSATPTFFTISGTVRNSSGASLSTATVTVKSGTTGIIVKTVYTASNGLFSVGSLKPDKYWIVVSKRGYTFPFPDTIGNPAITVGPSSSGNSITANP
jgi:PKD repeat protein